MIDASILVPQPHVNDHRDNDMWVDEQIWGHRLWDNESPWLLFLEFLGVAEACQRDGKLLKEGGRYYPLNFWPHKRLYLRNILFNNKDLFQIAERYPDSATGWKHWLAWMDDNAQGVSPRDFSYLRTRFHSFHEFAALVGMLGSSAVESDSNKRWSSRFVFPFGQNALYEDLRITPTAASREYINFGRTGELLYLMLCRSSQATQLLEGLTGMVEGRNPWNTLLGLMQPGGPSDAQQRGNSFLPYSRLPSFDRLGEDWLAIQRLRLPGFDAYPHLVTLSALHVVLYQLNVAGMWVDAPRRPHFVCEIVAPRKTLIRELSAVNYQENQLLPQRAIEASIKTLEDGDEWHQSLVAPDAFSKCKQLLLARFRWPQDEEDYEGCNSPESLLSEFRKKALARHRRGVANVHRAYGRDVGLVSKRGTNRLRYAPTDSLLKALILANVERRMEYKEFLDRLYERYGFVIDDRAGASILQADEFDQKAFRANAQRLEQRLTSLGMLRRLSDACAYVRNPLSGSAE